MEQFLNFTMDELRKGSLRLSNVIGLGPQLAITLAIVLIFLAFFAAVMFYRRTPSTMSPGSRRTLALLRGFALALLLLILLRPVLQTPMPATQDCVVAVVVDDSKSMTIADVTPRGAVAKDARKITRLAAAREILGELTEKDEDKDQLGLLNQLADVCPVWQFKFSGEGRQVRSLSEVRATGDRTSLYSALEIVEDECRNLPVMGVVLLTDGANNTAGRVEELADLMKLKKRPVYCIGLGDPDPPNDYEVVRVQAPREAQANTSVELYATIRAGGFTEPFEVYLLEDNKELDKKIVAPQPDMDVYRVPLGFLPDRTGQFNYSVRVPVDPREVIDQNNQMAFTIKVVDNRLPVLYLEGSPREEYRFLRRALFRDEDYRIASILRLTGPKKYLLQGVEEKDGIKPAPEAGSADYTKVNGFPEELKHLNRFHAVILGDVEAGYLSAKQLSILDEFVRNGGGLMMLGGVNSFNLGSYHDTPVGKMLPVVLPDASVAYQNIEFNIELTKEGVEHPILRQSGNPLLDKNIWSKAPTLIGYNPIREVKPGATVLADEPKSKSPILVVQRYGAGRTAAFATGGSWHWRMALPIEEELHEKFWRQVVRWLAAGAKSRLSVETDKEIYAGGETATIRATVLDDELKPVDDADVTAEVEDRAGAKHSVVMRSVLSPEGVYEGTFRPEADGDYVVVVTAALKDKPGQKDKDTATASASFSVGGRLDEFNNAAQNARLLKDVARRSGGEYVPAAEAAGIVEKVREAVMNMERKKEMFEHKDIWDTPLLLGLLALALSVEWFIRRRVGLM